MSSLSQNHKTGFLPNSIEECVCACCDCFLIDTHYCHYPGKQKHEKVTTL